MILGKTAHSTSIHNLNADRGLSKSQKILYLFLNWANNLFPYFRVDQRIEFKKFSDLPWQSEWEKTYKESSPGRRLSDIFWRALPWEKIEEELGEIHVFDTGCGHGNYATRLMEASGGRLASYTGVDAKKRENWAVIETQNPNFHFIHSTSSDILPLIPPETNLFVTQSAIEHFDEDLPFFKAIKEFTHRKGTPVIQIHNIPGKAILPLYLFHGLRQYTPRTLSKITRIFGNADLFLYGLGGRMGKKVQWKYFTWPLLILRGKAKWSEDVAQYDKEVRKATEYDILNPSSSPLFWVLIIHSNPQSHIWKK
jgi:SAM-dependent methyltransferase